MAIHRGAVLLCLCLLVSTKCSAFVNYTEIDDFLSFYGYLPMSSVKPIEEWDRRSALLFMQFFYRLPMTGEADEDTVRMMRQRRCGCEDVVLENDIKKKMMMRRPRSLMAPQNYQVAQRGWPELTVTWKISKYSNNRNNRLTQEQQRDTMTRAFSIWAEHCPLRFVYKSDPNADADIDIRFEVGFHLPDVEHTTYRFDGKGGKLAHAFPPTSGMVHFDDDEDFDLRNPDKTDLLNTAAHEIGHALGLYHSNVDGALMGPSYTYTEIVQLHQDDIEGIQALYPGSGRSNPTSTQPTYPTRQPPTDYPTHYPTAYPTQHRPTYSTTRSPHPRPDFCDLQFDASFYSKFERKMYVFITEKVGQDKYTYVYKLIPNRPLERNRKYNIEQLFGPRYPFWVDAATYIYNSRTGGEVYLFWGGRLFHYRYASLRDPSYKFSLVGGEPKWLDVSGFPERPRAAIARPVDNAPDRYYVFIFGTTMLCDWNEIEEKVGAHCMPIQMFGRNMPLDIRGAVVLEDGSTFLFKGHKYYQYDFISRTILSGYPKELAPAWIKGDCGDAAL